MKTIKWNLKAREFVRGLDVETKKEIGSLLMLLQSGEVLQQPQSKPMKIIHSGAYELRIKDSRGAYRVIYVLAMKDKILIPHAFTKKTQKTSQKDIEVSIQRLRELIDEEK